MQDQNDDVQKMMFGAVTGTKYYQQEADQNARLSPLTQRKLFIISCIQTISLSSKNITEALEELPDEDAARLLLDEILNINKRCMRIVDLIKKMDEHGKIQ